MFGGHAGLFAIFHAFLRSVESPTATRKCAGLASEISESNVTAMPFTDLVTYCGWSTVNSNSICSPQRSRAMHATSRPEPPAPKMQSRRFLGFSWCGPWPCSFETPDLTKKGSDQLDVRGGNRSARRQCRPASRRIRSREGCVLHRGTSRNRVSCRGILARSTFAQGVLCLQGSNDVIAAGSRTFLVHFDHDVVMTVAFRWS